MLPGKSLETPYLGPFIFLKTIVINNNTFGLKEEVVGVDLKISGGKKRGNELWRFRLGSHQRSQRN